MWMPIYIYDILELLNYNGKKVKVTCYNLRGASLIYLLSKFSFAIAHAKANAVTSGIAKRTIAT
jgi:hypothetical protein